MRRPIIFVSFFFFYSGVLYCQNNSYSKNQIQEDLEYLKEVLIKHQPNAFLYTNKDAFEKAFDSINIPDFSSEENAYAIIASTASIIKDGHSYIFPQEAHINDVNKNGLFIPFKVFWNGKALFISDIYVEQEGLKRGLKINSINGTPAKEIIYFMLDRIMQDGNNPQYPLWIINRFFL